jgi:hypothetical protein
VLPNDLDVDAARAEAERPAASEWPPGTRGPATGVRGSKVTSGGARDPSPAASLTITNTSRPVIAFSGSSSPGGSSLGGASPAFAGSSKLATWKMTPSRPALSHTASPASSSVAFAHSRSKLEDRDEADGQDHHHSQVAAKARRVRAQISASPYEPHLVPSSSGGATRSPILGCARRASWG